VGVTQQWEAQSRQGRGKGATSPVCRGLAVGNQRPRGARGLAEAGYGAEQITGSKPGCWLVGARWGSHLGAACRGRHRRPGGRRLLPLDGGELGRGEKREGEREGPGFKLNFHKIPSRNLKTLNMRVVGNLKSYNFCFSQKFI
jgi:hypothetical protein